MNEKLWIEIQFPPSTLPTNIVMPFEYHASKSADVDVWVMLNAAKVAMQHVYVTRDGVIL